MAVPLCVMHHRNGKDAVHMLGRRFAEHHGLDMDSVVAELNTAYKYIS